jgi:ketosteroid isomerase-like protein
MSQENLEIVRRIYGEWGRGNFREGTELYDPHVLLVVRPEFGLVSGVYCGPDEIARFMGEEFLAEWEGALVIEGDEFTDAGDSVVVRVNQRATGRESGTPVHLRYFQIWTFRGASVMRIESVMERADALEAAGLRE